MYGLNADKLKQTSIKGLNSIFSRNIKFIFDEFKFARISCIEEEKIIADTLEEVKNNLEGNDINSIYQLVNNILRNNIISYLKKYYKENKNKYKLVLGLLNDKIKKIYTINDAKKNIDIIIYYLNLFDVIDDENVLKTIARSKELETTLKFIINDDFKCLDSFGDNKGIVMKILYYYDNNYTDSFLRSKCHDLFGVLYMYEKSDILEAINMLPDNYKTILQLRFGENYDTFIRSKEWTKKYNYMYTKNILPLIKNLLFNKVKNNNEDVLPETRNKDLFSIFINYPFSLVLSVINSLPASEQIILQGKFGNNYNELLDDFDWDKKYRRTCYKNIIPFIFKRVKRLVKRESIEFQNVKFKTLLEIFSNYDELAIKEVINKLEKDEVLYLQFLYGKKYDTILVNDMYNINNNSLNKILSKIRINLEAENLKEETNTNIENKKVGKRSQSLLYFFKEHNYNLLLEVIETLTDIEKELLIKRYGSQYKDVLDNVTEEEKAIIIKKIIPKIRRRILRLEVLESSNLEEKFKNVENDLRYKLIFINNVFSSTYFNELLRFLNYEEATIVALKYIGYNDVCFTTEEIADYLGMDQLEVISIAKEALKKYNKVATRKLKL